MNIIPDKELVKIPVIENGEPMIDVRTYCPGLSVDLDNKILPEGMKTDDRFFLVRKKVADRIVKAQLFLPSGYKFILYSAFRPLDIQEKMFKNYLDRVHRENPHLSETQAKREASKYIAPIDVVPPHVTGGAVDLSIISPDGRLLDMGTGYSQFIKATATACPDISAEQKENRKLLVTVMEKVGFVNYPTEWWHWSYGDRYWAAVSEETSSIYGIVETDKKKQTVETYNKSVRAMADKFNSVGPRGFDISKTLKYWGKSNPKVLEIGCGNGRDAGEILKFTDNYLGIDISEAMIKIARETSPQAQFKVADCENFKFEKGTDVIFAFASLLHSDQKAVKSILEQASNALSEQGLFFISLKHGNYKEFIKKDEFGVRTFYYYTPELIEELADGYYKKIYQKISEIRGQTWFEILLEKI